MKVYLDVCCLNRCFDDQRQARVRLEAEAVALILERVERGVDEWLVSAVIEQELMRNPDLERRERVLEIVKRANGVVPWSEELKTLGRDLARRGIPAMDALHVAAAEVGGLRCALDHR